MQSHEIQLQRGSVPVGSGDEGGGRVGGWVCIGIGAAPQHFLLWAVSSLLLWLQEPKFQV